MAIFGWDISTSIIGATVLKDDGTYMASSYCDLRKVEGLLIKGVAAESFVHKFVKDHSLTPHLDQHHVEERLGNFSGGRSMIQVLMILGAFNLLVSNFIFKLSSKLPLYIHPSTMKATLKKEGLIIPKGADKKALTLTWALLKAPNFPLVKNRNDKPQPFCYDMADSFGIARAGFLRSYLSQDAKGTEASSD